MQNDVIAVVWPTPDNYPRFREVCGPDEVPDTFLEFVQMALARIADMGIDPARITRVTVDPDAMQHWGLRHHGKIDNQVRALYALHILRQQRGEADLPLA